jgi:hypothetical protein
VSLVQSPLTRFAGTWARCGVDTAVPGVYNITFVVYNSAGLASNLAVRTVTVKVVCPTGEFVCSNQVECSQGGACLEDLGGLNSKIEEQVKDEPPSIWLVNSTLLTEFVAVRQFARYAKCAAGTLPAADALCEPGARAMDREDGNLTFRVLACPPATCIERGDGCTGHEFSKKGLQVRARRRPPCELRRTGSHYVLRGELRGPHEREIGVLWTVCGCSSWLP